MTQTNTKVWFDSRPHAVVIYNEPDPDDNGRWVKQVIGPFPTREDAQAESHRAQYYGVETDLQPLFPPYDEAQAQVAPVDTAPTQSYSHSVALICDRVVELINEAHRVHNATTRDVAIQLGQFLHDSYTF